MSAFYATDDKYADVPARLHNPADLNDICKCGHGLDEHAEATSEHYAYCDHSNCPCDQYREEDGCR